MKIKILVLAENTNNLKELCSGARKAGDRVEMVAIGEAQKTITGADKVWFIPAQDGAMLEDYTDTIAALIGREIPDFVWVEPTKRFKLIAGRLAAILGSSVITNAMELSPEGEVKHMVYGGTAIRKEKGLTAVTIVMINPGVIKAGNASADKGEIETLEFIEPAIKFEMMGTSSNEKVTVNLQAAKKVIGVGRGIAQETDLSMIRELAQAIDGEVGCTRPIVEAEYWMPKESYIGVSGLMLSPSVYLAIGISGQVQHTVGIDRSQVIIAINNDKNAPIFKQSDYGIVGDIYKVVPELIKAFK